MIFQIITTYDKEGKRLEIDDYSASKMRILKQVQDRLVRVSTVSDEEVIRQIEECILSDRYMINVSSSLRSKMRRELYNRIRRLDVLSELLDDDSVTEIMVNGVSNIFVERNGRIKDSGIRFESTQRLFDVVGQIAAGVNRSVNLLSPILDARLDDGSRVNIVLNPIALNGPILTIRRFPNTPVDAARLISLGSITPEVLDFLEVLVKAKYNILISGGTGSGKTTFLNVMTNYIPNDERIITIEDSAELKVQDIPNLVRLETRNASLEGAGEITIRDLIKAALRMRPDRIIVGEVRGEEAIDMLQAFSVGQDGSLSTIHANHAEDALYRLETMIMLSTRIPIEALRRQIASGIDIIVQLGRLRDGSRHLLEVREVIGMCGNDIETTLLYEFVESGSDNGIIKGNIIKRSKLTNIDKLKRSGINYELR